MTTTEHKHWYLLCICLTIVLDRNAKGRIEHERLLRTSRRELSEMNDAWKIDSAEIILKNRIDSESPGGFGEVRSWNLGCGHTVDIYRAEKNS